MSATLLMFVALSIVTVATPGPTTLLAFKNSADYGVRATLPGIAGAMLSDLVLIASVGLGLGAVLRSSATAFELLRWAGVAYLIWLGLVSIRASRCRATDKEQDPPRRVGTFLRSFNVAVTNPKCYLFFAAVLPTFIDATQPLSTQYVLLAALFTAMDGIVLLGYAVFGAISVRSLRLFSPSNVNRLSGFALLLLALSLALWKRPEFE